MIATTIAPLRNKDGEGRLYRRSAEIEAKLSEILVLGADEIIARCAVQDMESPEYIPSECLVYLIREYRSKDLDACAEAIVKTLVERVLMGLPRAESLDGKKENLHHSNVRDELRYRFVAMLAQDRQDYLPALDFFEIRFQKALYTLRADAKKKVRRNENRPTEGIEDPETGKIAQHVEEAAIKFDPRENHLSDNPEYRSRLYQAIDALPDLQRAIVVMWLEGFPIESNEPGAVSISSSLGKTPKTIASHRDMAFATLSKVLTNGEIK